MRDVVDHQVDGPGWITRRKLAQPAISSSLIDNLNASLHLRTLLTDLFLLDDVLGASRNGSL